MDFIPFTGFVKFHYQFFLFVPFLVSSALLACALCFISSHTVLPYKQFSFLEVIETSNNISSGNSNGLLFLLRAVEGNSVKTTSFIKFILNFYFIYSLQKK